MGEREFNLHPALGEGCEHAIENRKLLAKTLGIALEDTVWFDPDTSGEVQWIGAEALASGALDWSTRITGTSGLVAQCTNIILCTLCNDNVTVILFDPRMYSLALVNIDTKRLSAEPVEQAIDLMIERGDAAREEIIGLITPSIGPCCHTFSDPSLNGAGRKSNLWDTARTAMSRSHLNHAHILNTRICTACRDSEFFSRAVEGSSTGAGALMVGVMDNDGSLAETLRARKARADALERRASRTGQVQAHVAEPSLSEEERRLNSMIRCPYGQKKVYVRSVIVGGSDETTQPAIALRCAVMAHVKITAEGYNIVGKDYIEHYCCSDYEECEAYKAFMLEKKRGGGR